MNSATVAVYRSSTRTTSRVVPLISRLITIPHRAYQLTPWEFRINFIDATSVMLNNSSAESDTL